MTKFFALAAAMILTTTSAALAHHPLGGMTPTSFTEGFLSGIGHPVIGFDHLAFVIAVGLIAAPVMASVASAITPSSRHGAVQALLQAFSSLSEGAGPAAFGWLLASLPGGPRAALPGLPFALGVAAAALGLCLSAGAIERGRAFARLASLPLGAPLLVGSSSPAL